MTVAAGSGKVRPILIGLVGFRGQGAASSGGECVGDDEEGDEENGGSGGALEVLG